MHLSEVLHHGPQPILILLLLLVLFILFCWQILKWTLRLVTPRYRPAIIKENNVVSTIPSQCTLQTPASLAFSLIIPAYNEEKRLPPTLKDCLSTFNQRWRRDRKFTWEIIVVDDCSKDATATYVKQIAAEVDKAENGGQVRCVELQQNLGKGGAVTTGMRLARGSLLLFADADGASEFQDLALLEAAIKRAESEMSIAIGSRAHLVGDESTVKRTFLRNLLMHAFHIWLWLFGVKHIKDTQCGFKLFTRRSAQQVFPHLHMQGWVFDVEILLLAFYQHITVLEVPIRWEEVDGSKLNVARDAIKMARDVVLIRLHYMLGSWAVPKTKAQ